MKVEIISPRGSHVKSEAIEITAQGALGEFGVLPGHIPFLTILRPGVLRLVAPDGGTLTFAVGAGYLQVGREDEVVVLVDSVEPSAEVDAEEAQRALADLEQQLGAWEGERDASWQHLDAQRAWAQAQLDAKSVSSKAASAS